MSTSEQTSPDMWDITERWQHYLGELRVNMFRFLAIAVFYGLHTLNYLGWLPASGNGGFWQLGDAPPSPAFQLQVTLIASAWLLIAIAIHVLLATRWFPRWLPPTVVLLDILLLTLVLCVSNGPRSPLVVAYVLIQVLTALRCDAPLLGWATIGCIVGYLVVLGRARWPQGFAVPVEDATIPRYAQLVFLATLILVGLILQQLIERVRELALDYNRRVSARSHQQGD